MKKIFKQFLGIAFILIALVGIILSPIGIYGVWQVRTSVLVEFYDTTQLISATLDAASDGLVIVEKSLETASDSIDTATQVTDSLAVTMGDINVLAGGFQSFLNSGIASFLIPNKSELENTDEHLAGIQVELANMVADMKEVNTSVQDAKDAISTYILAIENIQEQLISIQLNGPKWINSITWIFTIVLAWLAIAQIGLITQGIEYLRSTKSAKKTSIIQEKNQIRESSQ